MVGAGCGVVLWQGLKGQQQLGMPGMGIRPSSLHGCGWLPPFMGCCHCSGRARDVDAYFTEEKPQEEEVREID